MSVQADSVNIMYGRYFLSFLMDLRLSKVDWQSKYDGDILLNDVRVKSTSFRFWIHDIVLPSKLEHYITYPKGAKAPFDPNIIE